jgi:hypothetical protein
MRYVISTKDEQGLIGMQIAKWEKEKKLEIIEKSETFVEIEANLQRIACAMETLKKAGYNSEVMKIYIQKKCDCSMQLINRVLYSQEDFLKQIGAVKK